MKLALEECSLIYGWMCYIAERSESCSEAKLLESCNIREGGLLLELDRQFVVVCSCLHHLHRQLTDALSIVKYVYF